MELYLDSVKFDEIEQANKLGFVTGLTTTPTFMHREGITDTDAAMLKLQDMVPVLQVESLGNNAQEILDEAKRLVGIGLNKETTVFKVPISLEGAKACYQMRKEGLMVNLHLVYTLQQAYMAYEAGATYICPLVGRLQDQGNDALALIEDCMEVVNKYSYETKVMFSSVRTNQHVREALKIGMDACTMPWKVLKVLPDNNLTSLGTQQFEEHTRLMTTKAVDVIAKENTVANVNSTVLDASLLMTQAQTGAIIVLNDDQSIFRIFTDGDLRRLVTTGEDITKKKLSELGPNEPVKISTNATLLEVSDLLKEQKVDNVVVVEDGKYVGLLDIQDVL